MSARLVLALQVDVRQTHESLGVGPKIVAASILAAFILSFTILGLNAVVERRRRAEPPPDADAAARSEMDRLCPDGWSASLTVFGHGAPRPDDAPAVAGTLVRVEWTEYGEEEYGDRPVRSVRQAWARSVTAAQKRMVDERRIDAQLEEVERRVLHETDGPDAA